MRIVRCLLALALLFALHGHALAESPSPAQRAEASNHFRRGVELFEEEAFRASLVEFERAYAIAPDYRLLYNIGQTKLRLQDYLGAVQSYESYLSQGGSAIPPERRTQVEDSLGALRDRIGRVAVTCNRADVEITVDDQMVGKTPLGGTIPLNVGRHRISARAPDGVGDSKIIDVAGGDIADVSFELAVAPQVAVGRADAAEEPGWSGVKKAAVASWSLGAAALVGSAVTGALALNQQGKVDDLLSDRGLQNDALKDEKDKLKTLALTTDVLIGVGATAVVVGTVLWLVDRRSQRQDTAADDKPSTVRLVLGPTSAALRGAF